MSERESARLCQCFPVPNNVKFHFRPSSNFDSPKKLLDHCSEKAYGVHFLPPLQRGDSYEVRCQARPYVFTLFKGFVNVTGAVDFEEDLGRALTLFNAVFLQSVSPQVVTVDTSTAAGKITGCSCVGDLRTERVDLEDLKSFIDEHLGLAQVFLKPLLFLGTVIRRREGPSIHLVSSGKYSIVGGKSREEIGGAHRFLCWAVHRVRMLRPRREDGSLYRPVPTTACPLQGERHEFGCEWCAHTASPSRTSASGT